MSKGGIDLNALWVYAIYKGDEVLCEGTKYECAKYLHVEPKHIEWLATPSYQKRIENRHFESQAKVAFRMYKKL